ncbi:unnamed protein product, partial [Vitis vinifera]|uniref:Uncharacterized protein n=1 Tax=Vitis vinifera TaxID=29760 RepID=D7TSS3_VITVI
MQSVTMTFLFLFLKISFKLLESKYWLVEIQQKGDSVFG